MSAPAARKVLVRCNRCGRLAERAKSKGWPRTCNDCYREYMREYMRMYRKPTAATGPGR